MYSTLNTSNITLKKVSKNWKWQRWKDYYLKTNFLFYIQAIEVRLAGSAQSNQGRVEVKYNGQWGTICDDYWGISEAHVICRMLNHSGAEFAPREAAFGPGRSSYPIWLDTVKCRGDEPTIAACRHDGWRQHDCRHSEDASVVCWRDSAPSSQGKALPWWFRKPFNRNLNQIVSSLFLTVKSARTCVVSGLCSHNRLLITLGYQVVKDY